MIARLAPPWPWRALAVTAALGVATGFGGCWWLRDQMAAQARLKVARAETKAAVHIIEKVARADAATQAIGEASAARAEQIRVVYRDIIREVPTYVTAEADRRCDVPLGFVRLHDAAAHGVPPAVPQPAGPSHDAASGVELSAVAATVAGNYGLCHETAERLSALQGWVRTQQALAADHP